MPRITKSHSIIAQQPSTFQSSLPTPPKFKPLWHKHPLHFAFNTLLPVLRDLESIRPSTIFSLFFTQAIIELMVDGTNCNAQAKSANENTEGSGCVWYHTNAQEIQQWLGILMYIGLFCMPAIRDYWIKDERHPRHPISEVMGLTRFEQLQRYFHISGPLPNDNSPHSWHTKVDPLITQVMLASRTLQMISSYASIDEAMIRYTGHSRDTFKMKHKPTQEGFKMFCLASAG